MKCQSQKQLKDHIPGLFSRLLQSGAQHTPQISVSIHCIFPSAVHPSCSSNPLIHSFAFPVNKVISDILTALWTQPDYNCSIQNSCQRMQINECCQHNTTQHSSFRTAQYNICIHSTASQVTSIYK